MAAPTCTTAGFQSGAACFKPFSRSGRLSLLIYFNAIELAAIGGTNYTAQLGHSGTLMSASECFLLLDNPVVIPSLPYLVIAYNNAVNAGGAPASTKAALSAAIACNIDFTFAQRAAQLLLLQCSLGSHKAYPQ
jgi:hypothetical protein